MADSQHTRCASVEPLTYDPSGLEGYAQAESTLACPSFSVVVLDQVQQDRIETFIWPGILCQ